MRPLSKMWRQGHLSPQPLAGGPRPCLRSGDRAIPPPTMRWRGVVFLNPRLRMARPPPPNDGDMFWERSHPTPCERGEALLEVAAATSRGDPRNLIPLVRPVSLGARCAQFPFPAPFAKCTCQKQVAPPSPSSSREVSLPTASSQAL